MSYSPYFKAKRYYYWHIKRPFNKWLGRKWKLLRTPKDQRPVIQLLWNKMDEAQQQMVDEIGRQLYGGKELDGLGSLFDDKK